MMPQHTNAEDNLDDAQPNITISNIAVTKTPPPNPADKSPLFLIIKSFTASRNAVTWTLRGLYTPSDPTLASFRHSRYFKRPITIQHADLGTQQEYIVVLDILHIGNGSINVAGGCESQSGAQDIIYEQVAGLGVSHQGHPDCGDDGTLRRVTLVAWGLCYVWEIVEVGLGM
ncbi:hypothetical protein K491DRAFT_681581 [Lophiostoma macrostomum CBS 122681]|uniref:Uncharacterized protein n=1 Tax=Lophiostoma macrostomum CBS 122681 TaxID=1314788 RepID=A0A6A6SYX3_9PLEO|nr:hypothetical protein K491DRAFT_681581 [Lophiostoma macrostomum CBS 122681]